MCDSGISLSSSFRDVSASDESDGGNHFKMRNSNYKRANVTPKLLKSEVTKSHYNLTSKSPSPHLSRSSSTLSLATSSNRSSSPVTVMEVRTLTNNFQKMLTQATQEIKKLNIQKTKLEKEQEKLLIVNIELATEAKRLVKENKDGKIEKEGLLVANDEFAEEVKRLYTEEEIWEEEMVILKAKTREISEKFSKELKEVQEGWDKEKQKFKIHEEKLIESVRVLSFDNDRVLQEREKETSDASKSHTEIKEDYEEQILKLGATIACLKSEIESEQIMREESDKHIEELSEELEKFEREMDTMRKEHTESKTNIRETFESKVNLLERKSEKLAAENFEYAVENEELEKKLNLSLESHKKYNRELNQLKVENQWLVSDKKKSIGSETKVEDISRELQDVKRELKEEKEKVQNLLEWKSQLAEKNKELKDENNRLFKKTEDLEHLMNEEATDINAMLNTISNLQVGKDALDMKKVKRSFM